MKALMRATALAVTLAAATPAVVHAQSMEVMHQAMSPTFNLSARGEVRVAPDMATITTGVQTEAATAQEAMQQNASRMTQVVAALRRAGIAERDIQTSGLNLNAVYDYPQNEQPRLRGYQASNQVTVVVRDLNRVGQAADAVVSAGANQINGIAFGLQNPAAAEDQARREAIRVLQSRAQLYSEATGLRLVGLRTLTEGGGYIPPQPMAYARVQLTSADAGASTPVQGGELVVGVDVTGVYDVSR